MSRNFKANSVAILSVLFLWGCGSEDELSRAIIPPPNAPTELLVTPTSPNKKSAPVITVSGVTVGHTITLYVDDACTDPSGSNTVSAGSNKADITVEPALKKEGRHTFYAKAKSPSGKESPCSTAFVAYTYDATAPTVTIAGTDLDTAITSKTWEWSCSESCTYRFAINESQTHSFTSADKYANATTATQSTGNDTKYYLHVQAKDMASNESLGGQSVCDYQQYDSRCSPFGAKRPQSLP